jgi:hypothetical protein
MTPLEVFGSVGTLKGTSLRKTALLEVKIVKIGRAVFAGRGDKERKKNKLTQSLYVDPL